MLDVRRDVKYRDWLVSDYLNKEEVREKIGAKKGTEMVPCNKSIPWVLTDDIMRGYKHEVCVCVLHLQGTAMPCHSLSLSLTGASLV